MLPKNMSLHATTRPPFSSAARSMSPPARDSASQSGVTSPSTRSRATPPSGKMFSRRCVAERPRGPRTWFSRVALERRAASTVVHAAFRARRRAGAGIPRRRAASSEAGLRIVAAEDAPCRRRPPRTMPGQAEPDDAPVVAGLASAPRLPAVHPLAAVGVLVRDPDRRGPDRIRFSFSAKNSSFAASTAPPSRSEARSTSEDASAHRSAQVTPPIVHERRPRSQVWRTTPRSWRPAYGVIGWRWNSDVGSTTERRRPDPRRRDRRRAPGVDRALCVRRALRGARARSTSQFGDAFEAKPCARAPVQTAGNRSWSDAMPPHARQKSPLSSAFIAGGRASGRSRRGRASRGRVLSQSAAAFRRVADRRRALEGGARRPRSRSDAKVR